MTITELPNSTGFVSQPGKLMRITALARAMLDEARDTPCDAAGCEKFRNIYERTIAELDGVLSDDLHAELVGLAVRFDDPAPSPSELRIAQAELVGWLDGLMNGIVIAVRSQQADAEAKAEAIEEAAVVEAAIDPALMPGQYL